MVDVNEIYTLLEIKEVKKRNDALNKWSVDAMRNPPEITGSTRGELEERARNYLETGDRHVTDLLLSCLAAGTPKPAILSKTGYTYVPAADQLRGIQAADWEEIRFSELYQIDLLKKWGFFSESENVLLSDFGSVHFGTPNLSRVGRVFLTDQRIVAYGDLQGPAFRNEPSYRPLYDDWESQPFLQTYDYVRIADIKSAESIWSWSKKYIEVQVHTRYAKEKGGTLYGPYFFKFDRPSTVKEEFGLLKVLVEPLDMSAAPGLPKDWKKTRQDTFFRLLNELTGK